MMGRLKSDQGQLCYEFCLGDAVPEDHLVRKIDAALDLSWLRSELAPHYSSMGRPSIDPDPPHPDAASDVDVDRIRRLCRHDPIPHVLRCSDATHASCNLKLQRSIWIIYVF